MSEDVIGRLAETIKARRQADAGASYTRALLDAGTAKCARKFGEEAIELVVAALGEEDRAVTSEAADVIYHLLVLLEARGIALDDVTAMLAERTKMSGHAEKSSRSPAG